MVKKNITCDWSYSVQFYNCLQFGARIDTNRVAIQLSPDHNNGNTHTHQFDNCSANSDTGIYICVDCVQFYDVQKCNSEKIANSTYVVQKAKSLNYFATTLKYQFY